MSENLADEIFAPEPVEHDQNLITAMEVRGSWVKVVPGTMEIAFNDKGEVEFFVDMEKGGVIQGVLTEITGLESLPYEGTDDGE